jgi:hypothetical protein
MAELPFALYSHGGRKLLGAPPWGDGTARFGYGLPVFRACGFECVYCGRVLRAYEEFLNISIDHVIPTNTVQNGFPKEWVADLINLVTACRACNEFLNGYRVQDAPPVTLDEFCNLRDRHFLIKRDWVRLRHERERARHTDLGLDS